MGIRRSDMHMRKRGGIIGPTTTVWTKTLTTQHPAAANRSVRNVIIAGQCINPGTYQQLRVQFTPGASGSDLIIDNMAVGDRDGSTDDTLATPIELLEGGTSGLQTPAGTSLKTDWLDFEFIAGTDDLLVIMDLNSVGANANYRYVNSGYAYYSDPGNSFDQMSVSYTGHAITHCIDLIEARTVS